eukprot:COSAG05_NODE_4415_length_1525_cov_1.206872_1_plen_256_part_00
MQAKTACRLHGARARPHPGRAAPMPLRWRRGRGTNGMHVATAAAMLGALALMAAVRSLPGTGISVLPVAVGAVDHGGARASTGHTPALLIVNVTTAATARASTLSRPPQSLVADGKPSQTTVAQRDLHPAPSSSVLMRAYNFSLCPWMAEPPPLRYPRVQTVPVDKASAVYKCMAKLVAEQETGDIVFMPLGGVGLGALTVGGHHGNSDDTDVDFASVSRVHANHPFMACDQYGVAMGPDVLDYWYVATQNQVKL